MATSGATKRQRPAAAVDSSRGWVAVGAGFTAMFTVFGVAYSFGAFFRPMAAEFDTGRGATSAVFSITAFLYFTLGSITGYATDRVGPRKVLLVGAAAMAGGLILTSRVNSLFLGYVTYGLGVGVGVACGYVPMVSTVSAWFERRRGSALGIAVAGIGFGTVTVAPLAAFLIDRYGWRTTYVIFGVASGAVLVVCAAASAPPPRTSDAVLPRLGPAVRTRNFRFLYLSALLMSLALFVPFVFLAPFAEARGVSEVAAATLVGAIGGASIAGRLAIGLVADRIGHLRAYRGCFLLMAASFAIWLGAERYPLLVVFAVVLGVGYGGFIALSPAVIAGLFGTEGLGGLIGLSYTGAGFGGLVGPPLAGLIIDRSGSYRWAIAASLVFALSSWAALWPVGPDPEHRVSE